MCVPYVEPMSWKHVQLVNRRVERVIALLFGALAIIPSTIVVLLNGSNETIDVLCVSKNGRIVGGDNSIDTSLI